jgi:phosphatidylglycerophosphate synthase
MRPRELEDGLNFYLYHPLAWRLAMLLAKTPLTPNMVSVIGGGCVVAAAYAYTQGGGVWFALLGMALHTAWHVVDGADGDLARITGKASPIGELVDGLCDYVSHIVLYLALGWLMARDLFGGWAWASWILVVLAGASHIAQANHVEVQRRSYQWWVYGKSWLGLSHGKDNSAARQGFFGAIAAFYLGVAAGMDAGAKRLDAAILALQDDVAGLEKLRARLRAHMPPLFRLQRILGPNPRALILGVSMLLGGPIWYFLYQTIVLNLLLVVSVQRHNAAAEGMLGE